MSPPDFTSMDRKALQAFRNMAFYRKEAPTVENNYFTTKSKDAPHPQPADWRPTPIATEWCEHHGPAQHTTGNCKVIADPENKGEQKKKAPKPKIDPKAFARWRIQYHEKVRASHPILLAQSTNKSHSSSKNSSC